MTDLREAEIQAEIRRLQSLIEKQRPQQDRPVQTGWLCPACGAGNAPFVQRCPCKGWPKMEITC